MHSKNSFLNDYDFDLLAKVKPELKEHVFVNEHGTKIIKFANQAALKALNGALLKSTYKIEWDLPEGYLCPPVPGRLNYFLHAAALFSEKDKCLLDIGTGANMTYPILVKCHFK